MSVVLPTCSHECFVCPIILWALSPQYADHSKSPQVDDTIGRKVKLRRGTETDLEMSLKLHSALEHLVSRETEALAPVQWTSGLQMRMWLPSSNPVLPADTDVHPEAGGPTCHPSLMNGTLTKPLSQAQGPSHL